MNRNYSLISRHPAASLLPSARASRRLAPLAAAVMLGLLSMAARAQTVALPVFDPTVNDGNVGATIASGGATVTLQGPATQIVPGITGRVVTLLPDLFAAGLTTDPRANPADPASLVVNTGARTQIVSVPDPITGGTRNVAVYVNANIIDTHATSNTFIYSVDVNGPTNGRQYINARIGGVSPTGGTLNVAIGTLGAPTDSADNFINLGMAKQTQLFYANGTGTAASTIVWQGSNFVDMGSVGGAINAAGPGPVQLANTFVFNSYRGQFTAIDGSTQTVTSAAQLQTYNTYLIGLLQAGTLNPDAYAAEFNRAIVVTPNAPITFTNGPPLPDEAYQPIGIRAVLRADGANATGIVAAGARLDVLNTTIDSRVVSSVNSGGLLATNGGTIINNGQVSFRRGGNDNGAAIVVLTGGHAINAGVVNAGFSSGLTGAVDPVAPVTQNFSTGVYITGAASTYANTDTGIVNVAGPGGAGVQMFTGATGTNAGTINVGINAVLPTATSASSSTDGVRVTTLAQFTNLPTGQIYLGRRPQYTPGAAADDILNNATPLTGISVTATGAATNAGTITIGSLTQGSAGISVNTATGAVLNSGRIDILGAASASPTENVGIAVLNSANVTNTGTINVAGINGIGMKLLSTSATAAASSGTINVTGDIGPTGLRNYGIWSEGAASMATLSGDVNLGGDGAIGVHARADGDVTIAGAGNVNFVGGTGQVGYFLYGTGSTISNTGTAAQNVSTAGSTLFRIEDGAVFNGGSGGSVFTASGQGATAFNITGAPSTFDSGNVTLNLSGQDSLGVLVEGGAAGTITGTAIINQTGAGSVAGIVDGQKHGLGGAPVGSPVASTLLTTAATLTSALDGVTGYIARNQGQLVNTGNLTFTGAGTTGVRVESGATAGNAASIFITDGGTGIAVTGPAGGLQTTANNSGTITVAGGSIAARTRGVVAEGPLATANMQTGATLSLEGVGAIGAAALGGGQVTVAGTATPVFGNTDQIAFHALGTGSAVLNSATALDASGARATLFRIEDGARLTTASALTASGQGAVAVSSTGAGAAVDISGGSLDISGAAARGIIVEGGAVATLAAGTTVTLSGVEAVVGVADGQKHDLAGLPVGALNPATLLANQASMTLSGPAALAFIAQNQGRLLNQGALLLTGAGATGVHVLSGGVLDNQADITVSSGTGIEMEGSGSQVINTAVVAANDGVAALHVHDGGGGVLGGTFRSDGTAHTVLVGSGATGLDATGVTLTSEGTGNGIENAAETAAITLTGTTINVVGGAGIRTATAFDPDATVVINVAGDGTGLAFQTASAAPASGNLALGGGYVINGNGAGAVGLLATTTGTVTSRATVAMNDASAGAALVAGTAASSVNAGTLTSMSVFAPVVDLSNGSGTVFSNQGTVAAADSARPAVLGGAGADTVNLLAGAVSGVVSAGEGDDHLRWSGGTLDGSIEMDAGNDDLLVSAVGLATTRHLQGGSGSDVLTLDAIQYRGGSFGADDLDKGVNLGDAWETINLTGGTGFTLTDDLRLGGSVLNIDAGSTLFAGAAVHPAIDAPAGGSVTVNNAGTIDLSNGSSGPTDTLTINGTYVGQGGRLRLDTYLNAGGPMSVSDVLLAQTSIVAAGPTAIDVLYPAGEGTLTTGDGILLVDVAGASANDAFLLGNRVVGGAYEYLLFQGGVAATGGNPGDGNWYLRNVTDDVTPPGPPEPEPPEPEPPEPEPTPPDVPILRPEVGVYLANHAAAAGMFLHTLHDRLGEVDYSERGRDSNERRGAWARVQRDQLDTSVGVGRQVKVSTHSSVYQLGGELGRWDNDDQRWHWGAMGGYGQANTRAVSAISGYAARGRVSAYNAGLYATWYQSASQATGAYLDGWVMYGRARQQVHGDALPQERVDSSTWTTSIEGGYAIEWLRGRENTWYIEPQAQLLYSHYAGGDHSEINGTVEQVRDVGGLTTRLGARAYARPVDVVHNRVQPFLELNWWHSDSTGAVAFNGQDQSLNHGRDIYELRIGAQAELGGGWTGWGHMALRDADGDYRGVEGLLGVKYRW
jgi:autotransporter family porin